jgi:hypothetical protein
VGESSANWKQSRKSKKSSGQVLVNAVIGN